MGFWDRISKIAGAVVDHGEAWKDLTFDVVRAPFTEDEYEGFGNTLLGIIQDDVVGGLMMTAIGPEGIGGQTIGAIPEEIREPVGTFTTEVLGRVDAWQDQWIERPISAGLLGFNIATQEGLGGFFDLDSYETAWEIASGTSEIDAALYSNEEGGGRGVSLGRAMALATMRVDPRDPRAVDEAAQSSFFNLYSGAWDFAETLFLDPLLIPGKYMQLARGGRFAATGTTDVAQVLRRTRRGEMTPTRTLYGRKLTGDEIQNFTSSRAQEAVNSKNWTNLDAAIEALPVSERIRQATKNSPEWEDLVGQRAVEIQEMVGRRRMNSQVAMALARATNSEMRRNHYLYMLGDQNAVKAAQEAASEMQAGLLGDFAPALDPDPGVFASVFDELEDVDRQINELRDTIKNPPRASSFPSPEEWPAYRERVREWDDATRPGVIADVETWGEPQLREYLENLPPGTPGWEWEGTIDELFEMTAREHLSLDPIRAEVVEFVMVRMESDFLATAGIESASRRLDEIQRLAARRDELVDGIYRALTPSEEWDFGFVFDIKSRFDARQMESYAPRVGGEYGNPVARFIAANDQDSLDLADAAIDQWLADSVTGPRAFIEEAEARGLLQGLGDESVAARVVREQMRTRQEMSRQIFAPLAIRAGDSLTGSATKLLASPARAVKGRRMVQVVSLSLIHI